MNCDGSALHKLAFVTMLLVAVARPVTGQTKSLPSAVKACLEKHAEVELNAGTAATVFEGTFSR